MNKVVKKSDLKEWRRKYTEEFDRYSDFTQKLSDLLKELIGKRVDISQIESRTKTINSFVKKIKRKQFQYGNPLKDITDLSGIRIITYYKEDTYAISNLIEDEFIIDSENSIDKSQIIDIDKFGYQSIHYVISLSKTRDTLPEWKTFENLKAEIQVRTVLQHAWASISHKLTYKTVGEAPKESRRKLYRLSALLELADDEFSGLQKMSIEIDNKYKKEFSRGKFKKTEVNLDSLLAYFKKSKEHKRWTKLAFERDINIYDEVEDFNSNLLTMLVKTLACVEIKNINDLNFLLRSFDKNNLEFFKTIINNYEREKSMEFHADPFFLIIFIVLYAKKEHVNESVLDFIGISFQFGKEFLKFLR